MPSQKPARGWRVCSDRQRISTLHVRSEDCRPLQLHYTIHTCAYTRDTDTGGQSQGRTDDRSSASGRVH